MCDMERYRKIYHEIEQLEPEDTLQLVLEASTEEQKDFYEMIGDYLLQQRQKKAVAGNLF